MFVRTRVSLDGLWQFYPAPCSSPDTPPGLGDQVSLISVPGPWQADERFRDYTGAAWYQRPFELPAGWLGSGQMLILGFGAVDYTARVWLNGEWVGVHEGGYLPFELDVTAAARAGENRLAVYVDDPLESFAEIPHGKQSWYGLLSGIWQPVWLERRSALHIQRVKITPQEDGARVAVSLSGVATEKLQVEVRSPEGQVSALLEADAPDFFVPIDHPACWSPDEPNLYTLRVAIGSDQVTETFGFRTIETRNGQILLNGRPFYMRAALDQDYYPGLICTPPSQDYIEAEFRQAKAMGLNCLRVHIKVADPRYYAAADKVGLLIWTELPNHTFLTETSKRRALETLAGMVERDWNHPSIMIWTIINESWGIDLTDPSQRAWLAETYAWLKELDPSRLVVGNSACWGNAHVATDLADFHIYYAMPDHAPQWDAWLANYARRPGWIFVHAYQNYAAWRQYARDPWNQAESPLAPEVRQRGDEPLVVSEFGNWGLPDIGKLTVGPGGQAPWWFDTGLDWGEGVVYPRGIENRFKAYHLDRVFPSLTDLTRASQDLQFAALKYEIEQIRSFESIQGYVITEFTDVHWECNGLLDMMRNPKQFFPHLARLNAENVLIPRWARLNFYAGEACTLPILYSYYSANLPENAVLHWRVMLPATSEEVARGYFPTPPIRQYGVTELGQVAFNFPKVIVPSQARLELHLQADDQVLASSMQEMYIFPDPQIIDRWSAVAGRRIVAPEFQSALNGLGCSLVPDYSQAELAIVSRLDDRGRDFLLRGGRVLLLAEDDDALQTYVPGVQITSRAGSPWQGDWASSFGWHRFTALPTQGVINFAFVGLTPEHVIRGLAARDFAQHVFAGMFVGWLHKPIPVVARWQVGQGVLLISTFRLRQNLSQNPLADFLFRELLALSLSGGPE